MKSTNKIPFDVFWNEYSYKRGAKKKCERKWNNYKLKDQEVCLQFIETIYNGRDFSHGKNPNQFKKMPETFLNQMIWESEDEWELEETIFVDDEKLLPWALRLKKKMLSSCGKICSSDQNIRHSFLNRMYGRFGDRVLKGNNTDDSKYSWKVWDNIQAINKEFSGGGISNLEKEIYNRMLGRK